MPPVMTDLPLAMPQPGPLAAVTAGVVTTVAPGQPCFGATLASLQAMLAGVAAEQPPAQGVVTPVTTMASTAADPADESMAADIANPGSPATGQAVPPGPSVTVAPVPGLPAAATPSPPTGEAQAPPPEPAAPLPSAPQPSRRLPARLPEAQASDTLSTSPAPPPTPTPTPAPARPMAAAHMPAAPAATAPDVARGTTPPPDRDQPPADGPTRTGPAHKPLPASRKAATRIEAEASPPSDGPAPAPMVTPPPVPAAPPTGIPVSSPPGSPSGPPATPRAEPPDASVTARPPVSAKGPPIWAPPEPDDTADPGSTPAESVAAPPDDPLPASAATPVHAAAVVPAPHHAAPADFAAPPPDAATPASPTAVRQAPAPGEQLAPALIQLAQAEGGTSRLTVRLDPEELGQVEVRIERTQAQAPRVRISAERPATLMLLLNDQPRLERMLDQAGLPSAGRSVSFHLAPVPPPVTPPPVLSSPDMPTQSSPSGTGGGTGGGSGSADASADRGGSSGGAPRHGHPTGQATVPDPETAAADPRLRWLRAGLDITA